MNDLADLLRAGPDCQLHGHILGCVDSEAEPHHNLLYHTRQLNSSSLLQYKLTRGKNWLFQPCLDFAHR